MRLSPILLAVLLAASAAQAASDDDDDDPKARHVTPVAKKPATSAKPAEAKKPAPAAAAAPAAAPARKAEPAPAVAHKEAAPATTPPSKKPAAATTDDAPPSRKLPAPPAEPKASALPAAPGGDAPSPATTLTGRAVRVRLFDGSTVVGQVHAEEVNALVIDCALGMLSIPRTRISTIAYDAAANLGQKRAPVQQLDDDLPASPPAKPARGK